MKSDLSFSDGLSGHYQQRRLDSWIRHFG